MIREATEKLVLIAAAAGGLATGMGCGATWYEERVVVSTELVDLAGAHVFFYADRVEIVYTKFRDTGWTAVFALESRDEVDTAVPFDTADTSL